MVKNIARLVGTHSSDEFMNKVLVRLLCLELYLHDFCLFQ